MSYTYSIGKFAKLIGKSIKTLQKWDREGTFKASRTPTGRRYYTDEDLRRFRSLPEKEKYLFAYCRVSSQAQRPDLLNQRKVLEEFCTARGLAGVEYIEEIGGGLNFKRKKFLELMDAVGNGTVSVLMLAHKDRLVRFGYDWFEHFCTINGCKILILNNQTLSPQEEMVQDLMTIIHCFSSRLYGLRNYKKDLKKALDDPSP